MERNILECSDATHKTNIWRPFDISGLLQTTVDGSPCISAGVLNIGKHKKHACLKFS